MLKLNIAVVLSPTFTIVALDPGAPVCTVPTAIVAAVPAVALANAVAATAEGARAVVRSSGSYSCVRF